MNTNRTTTPRTRPPGRRAGAVRAMYAGLLLTAAATVAPYADRATGHVLANHVRAGYPTYSDARVESAVTTWLVLLTAVGVLGAVCWLGSIWAVRSGRPWSRWASTAALVAGATVALSALLTKDTSGEVGLTPLLGVIGLLPSLAGVAAVLLLWRAPGRRHEHGHP